MAEQEAVNFKVRGSNPRRGARCRLLELRSIMVHENIKATTCPQCGAPIPLGAGNCLHCKTRLKGVPDEECIIKHDAHISVIPYEIKCFHYLFPSAFSYGLMKGGRQLIVCDINSKKVYKIMELPESVIGRKYEKAIAQIYKILERYRLFSFAIF